MTLCIKYLSVNMQVLVYAYMQRQEASFGILKHASHWPGIHGFSLSARGFARLSLSNAEITGAHH